MTALDHVWQEIEAMHLYADVQERLLCLVEDACLECQYEGYKEGESDTIYLGTSNPFGD